MHTQLTTLNITLFNWSNICKGFIEHTGNNNPQLSKYSSEYYLVIMLFLYVSGYVYTPHVNWIATKDNILSDQ